MCVLLYDAFISLKIVLILANSADPGDMPPYVAFHMHLHCLLNAQALQQTPKLLKKDAQISMKNGG